MPLKAKGENIFLQPAVSNYINDYTNLINEGTKGYVSSVGKELEEKTTVQAVVVIVKSLEGRDIESYAKDIFRRWGIGQKGKDNGLLILLSTSDKKWTVEVGSGLDGAVQMIESSGIMNEIGSPLFKENKYSEGIKDVYSAFSDRIAKKYNIKLEKNIDTNVIIEQRENVRGKVNGIYILSLIGLILFDIVFNKSRVSKYLLSILFIKSFGRGYRGWGGGGYGGFGGGVS